jgi:DNA repair protein SbcC/Rad50
MRIVQVVLQNVKSYAGPTTIPLLTGINAVCGENGAGKSTILEAIGFTLFGFKPYKLEAFLREGEKSGSITVTVEDDDGCTYHLVRKLGSGAGQAIYDEMNRKMAEGEADVKEWRRRFFGLEGRADLEELFRDTIGPPQGTLTAIFLESAAPRKEKFDRLLGITEYREAADGLRDVRNLFERLATEADRRAATLEGDVRRLPEVEGRQTAVTRRKTELASGLAARLQRQAQLLDARKEAERAQKAVQDARSALQLAESRATDATRRQNELAVELRRAEEAVRLVDASRAGHLAYEETATQLKQLEERRKQRDQLRRSVEMADRNVLYWEQEVKTAQEKLEALEQDEGRAAEREGLLPEQERREALVRQAEECVRAHAEAAGQLPEAGRRLEAALGRLREAQEQLSAVEAAKPEAARLEQLRERARELREGITALERQEWTLKQTTQELSVTEGRVAQLSREMDQLQAEITGLRPLEVVARLGAERQASRDELASELAALKSRHLEAQRSRKQVEGGLCPFLHETCRNLRPGVSLDAYFDGLVADTGVHLARTEAALVHAEAALLESRQAERAVSRLPDLASRASQLEEERDREGCGVAEQRQQLLGVAAAPQERERMEGELRRVEGELQRAEEATRRAGGETGWLRQRDDALEAKAREEEQLARLRDLVEAGAGAGEALAETRLALQELGNPREELRLLRDRIARERPAAERTLERAQKNAEAARAAAASAGRALEPFAALEEEMSAAAARRDESEPAHRIFLSNQAEAEQMPRRREAHQSALVEVKRTADAMVEARRALQEIQASYDPEEHRRILEELERVAAAVSSDRREIQMCEEDERRLLEELDGLRRSREQMEAAQGEASENRRLKDAVDTIRDVLKLAGPEMTKELLRRVSTRATTIYRDLMGEAAVSIEWGNDYEVRCRIRAEEREFKQLSGGEQMGAALAIRLALLQTISDVRLAFLDEPTAHMDATRRVNLAAQIQNLRSFDQLVVISHDDSFDTLFGHVVHLSKRDGATVVER